MGLFDTIKQNKLGETLQLAGGVAALPFAPAASAAMFGKYGAEKFGNPAQPIKTRKEMLAKDLNTLQSDPNALGMSDAEREKMIGQATRGAQAQQQQQAQQLNQAALAGQGFQAGALQDAARSSTDQGEAAAAQAAVGAGQRHQQRVSQERSRILGERDAAAHRAQQHPRHGRDYGLSEQRSGAGALEGAGAGSPAPAAGALPPAPPAGTAPVPVAPNLATGQAPSFGQMPTFPQIPGY